MESLEQNGFETPVPSAKPFADTSSENRELKDEDRDEPSYVTMEEVSRHDKATDAWVVVNGSIYE